MKTEELANWKASVALYLRNAEGLQFKTIVKSIENKIIISNTAPEQYKEPLNKLALYISDCQWVIEVLTDPYAFSLPGFENELIDYYPELLETLFNKGYDLFLLKLWDIENVLIAKYMLADIKMVNNEWTLLVREKEGKKTYFRRNGHFEDENGKEFSRGYGLEQIFWNIFDDKSKYKIPVINTTNIKIA